MGKRIPPGRLLIREGAATLSLIFPDTADHAAAARRIKPRAQRLMQSRDAARVHLGFFLYGVALAAGGERYA